MRIIGGDEFKQTHLHHLMIHTFIQNWILNHESVHIVYALPSEIQLPFLPFFRFPSKEHSISKIGKKIII